MELVYLWVKKYKNIENQGFNFSPRFECVYDGEKLTINEKEDYVSIFPENINITAIVGKNGSGKSNILKSLLDIAYLGNDSNINQKTNDSAKLYAIYYCNIKEKYFYKNIDSSVPLSVKSEPLQEKKHYTFYYNYTLDYAKSIDGKNLNTHYFEIIINSPEIPEYQNYEHILLQPKKLKKLDIEELNNIANFEMMMFSVLSDFNLDEINDFFIPSSFKLSISNIIISNCFKFKEKDFYTKLKQNNIDILDIEDYIKVQNIANALTIEETRNDPIKYPEIELHKDFHDFLVTKNKNGEFYKDNSLELTYKYITENNEYDKLLITEIDVVKKSYKLIEYLQNNNLSSMNKINNENIEIFEKIPSDWIEVSLLDKNNISLNSLSYGQQLLIKFIYSVLSNLNTIRHKNCNESIPKIEYINILLDEVELGLHPEWQKKFINTLVSVLKTQKDFKFNIIVASHSPFILSDLPKENVIFLDKIDDKSEVKYPKLNIDNLKDDNCINISEYIDIEPFGANIHTLLSHGFFMSDGLMGEFAKSKIDEVIKYLKPDVESTIKSDKEAKAIIEIVGEPILKTTLQTMYDAKVYKGESELDKLKRKQQEIAEAIKIEEAKNEKS